jgi:HNH endonuclease
MSHPRPIKYIITKTGCWVITSHKLHRSGYARIVRKINGTKREIKLHRWFYENKYGPIPEGLLVCHKCDNPPCVNPDHLFLGTSQDNQTDMVNKGRSTKGIKNPRAKLNPKKILIIKKLATQEKGTILAKRFGVSTTCISKIIHNKRWSP